MKKISVSQIYKAITKQSGVGPSTLKLVFPIFYSEILEAIKRGEDVEIHGFCRFFVCDLRGQNKSVTVGWDKEKNKPLRKIMYCRPKKRVRFRPMQHFRDAIAELNIREYGDQAFNTKERRRGGQKR